jgi:tryptophan synthase beta chain
MGAAQINCSGQHVKYPENIKYLVIVATAAIGEALLTLVLFHVMTDGEELPAHLLQNQIFDAATQFAKAQGFVPAPESAHAIRAAIDEAIAARESGQEKVILFNLSGHGIFDLQAYDDYLNQRLPEVEFSEEALADGLTSLPPVAIPG